MNLTKVLFALMCAVFLFASAHGCCCCCPCCCRCRHHYMRHQLLAQQRHGQLQHGATPTPATTGSNVVEVLRGKLKTTEPPRAKSTQTEPAEPKNNEPAQKDQVATKGQKN